MTRRAEDNIKKVKQIIIRQVIHLDTIFRNKKKIKYQNNRVTKLYLQFLRTFNKSFFRYCFHITNNAIINNENIN
jgi:hypothetical protein